MRVVFAGTPDFAARALDAVVATGHAVELVLTQPDRPAGRGMRMAASPVARCAVRHRLPLEKPASLKDAAAHERLLQVSPEVMIVAAYGLLLPPAVLEIPGRGCLNIHASLLPRWRGAAPIQRALLAGDRITGISIMRMDAGLDTGPVLFQRPLAIAPRETAGSLVERLAELGAACIVEALGRLDGLLPEPQDDTHATYAAKISKAHAHVDWASSADHLDRQIRAFNPVPGAQARIGGESLKIWEAHPCEGRGEPGEVLECDAGGLVVACGAGALRILVVQRPGGRPMPVANFLRGKAFAAGQRFELNS